MIRKKHKENILNPFCCEDIARQILMKIFNKYYFLPKNTMEYDIIGEDGERVEIKSTANKDIFDKELFWWHGNQKNRNLCAIYVDDSKLTKGKLIINWKFVKKENMKIRLKQKNLNLFNAFDNYNFKKINK